ncbi:MAG: hypothetical protein ACREBG_24615 [Pyrinomonadaceae bacterium]
MRLRPKGLSMFLTFISVVSVSVIVAQQPRNRGPRPAPAAPAPDLKIKYKTTTAGQPSESVTMIKGLRERSEMHTGYGMDTVSITQCDRKRTIQLSDNTRKYIITPMDSGDASAPASNSAAMSGPAEPSRRGGLLTYVTTANDTGERKEMFGFTARHVKSSIAMESSPDACNQVKQRIETDGWYVDLTFGLECNLGRRAPMMNRPVAPGGCQDRVNTKHVGAARTGFPLVETTTMYGADGRVTYTTTKEVVELSREPLDVALFDVPTGYVETKNAQELYGIPSVDGGMAQSAQGRPGNEGNASSERPSLAGAKQPGTLRVGVVTINNKSDRPVSLDTLRGRLVNGIEGSGIEAVPLNAISQSEAEAEAKARQCDFILYTDITTLKISAAKKIGGFLGRATGVGGIDKSDARVDFKLFAVGEGSPRLQSSATGKEEGDEASVGTALDVEARAVSAAVQKPRQ